MKVAMTTVVVVAISSILSLSALMIATGEGAAVGQRLTARQEVLNGKRVYETNE